MKRSHENWILVFMVLALEIVLLAAPLPATARPPAGINVDGGTVSAPAFSFDADPDTGLYRIGANNWGLAAGGVKGLDCTASACTVSLPLTHSYNPVMSTQSITPTANGVITPTERLVTITPASAVTITLGTCTTGWETTLYNSVNYSVVITDVGASGFNGAGNQSLGQYDTMRMGCFGGQWVQESAVSAN